MASLNYTILQESITTQAITLPAWIIILLVFTSMFKNLNINVGEILKTIWYYFIKKTNLDADSVLFLERRDSFVTHLRDDLDKIDVDTNWGDGYYTNLEAKVELTSYSSGSRFNWIPNFIRGILRIGRKDGIEKNLVEAILKSKSRSFLVVGEPGSGKTVSLHNLFRTLAKDCLKSKNKKKIVPIYLNLKYLDVESRNINADAIHEWVIKRITLGQDRTVYDFVNRNFDTMFNDGLFFFLFDSFDEIPAIMNSDDDPLIIEHFSSSIYSFFNSATTCRGLVCSRPYRAPIGHMGLKIRILSLSQKKIKEALFRYFGQERKKAKELWRDLNLNPKLLDVTKNPFYLGLFTQYIRNKKKLPENNYELFSDFVKERAESDEDRLKSFDLTPHGLLDGASALAYSMINTENIGLNVKIKNVHDLLNSSNCSRKWTLKESENLIDALVYSKFGQLSDEANRIDKSFSFAHRRFNEFFCASCLRQIHDYQPISSYMHKDKWREILVLLCEVLPTDNLEDIFDFSSKSINEGINADVRSEKRKVATKTIQFLKDGFHSRVGDIPDKLRILCSKYILLQLNSANVLEKNRCLEGAILVDRGSAQEIFGIALQSDSEWIKENVLISCRILNEIPKEFGKSIRSYLYSTHENGSIFKKYPTYEIYLSSYDVFKKTYVYARLLYYFSILEIVIYIGLFIISLITFNINLIMAFISSVLMYFLIIIHRYGMKTQNNLNRENKFIAFNLMFIVCLLTSAVILELKEGNIINYMLIPVVLLGIDATFYQLRIFYPENIVEFLRLIQKAIKAFPNIVWRTLLDIRQNIKSIALGIIKLFVASTILITAFSFWIASVSFIVLHVIESPDTTYDMPITFLTTVVGITPIVYMAYLIIKIMRAYLGSTKRLLRDYRFIKSVLKKPPHTFIAAINELNNLETDYFKKQFILKLPNWIDFDKDVNVLIDEAEKNNPSVSDELFKMVDHYEKLIPRHIT